MLYYFYLFYTTIQNFSMDKLLFGKSCRIRYSMIRFYDSILSEENQSDSESRLWLPWLQSFMIFILFVKSEKASFIWLCSSEWLNMKIRDDFYSMRMVIYRYIHFRIRGQIYPFPNPRPFIIHSAPNTMTKHDKNIW
jgi:hypothetical protein